MSHNHDNYLKTPDDIMSHINLMNNNKLFKIQKSRNGIYSPLQNTKINRNMIHYSNFMKEK